MASGSARARVVVRLTGFGQVDDLGHDCGGAGREGRTAAISYGRDAEGALLSIPDRRVGTAWCGARDRRPVVFRLGEPRRLERWTARRRVRHFCRGAASARVAGWWTDLGEPRGPDAPPGPRHSNSVHRHSTLGDRKHAEPCL